MNRYRSNSQAILLASCCLAFWIVGCGGADDKGAASRPKTISVSGKVTYKGSPLAGATVVFHPTTGPGATGMSSETGEFSLTTFEAGDGTVAGKHKVTVSKIETVGADNSYFDTASPNYGKEQPPEARGTTKHLVPERYGVVESSDLTADVPESGKASVTLELKE